MENGKQSAYPLTDDAISYENRNFAMGGLTKREHFASLAMQSFISLRAKENQKAGEFMDSEIVRKSIDLADLLLRRLED